MTKCILIVDDEKDICRVVQISLEKFAGWRAIIAESGEEGLKKAKTQALDAILLDVSMPDMDGLECFVQLLADPRTCSIPVIFLTAKVLPSDHQKFSRLGIAGVIAKPFEPMTVWQQVAQILDW